MKLVTVKVQARSMASLLQGIYMSDTYQHLLSQILHLALFNFLLFHLVLHSDSLTLFWTKARWH